MGLEQFANRMGLPGVSAQNIGAAELARALGKSTSRRAAWKSLAAIAAASRSLRAQQDPFRDHSRVPGLDEMTNAFDFEAVAYAKWPREVYDYSSYGGTSEFTLRRNRQAFDWVELVPKVIADVSTIQTATDLLGTKMSYPIFVCPSSGHGLLHPDGEAATHQGAQAASNTLMMVSNVSTLPIGKIAAAATSPLWYQLYPKQDLSVDADTLKKAQDAGCQGLVVTVDQQAAYFERPEHDRNLSGGAGGRGRAGRGAAQRPATGAAAYGVTGGRLWYTWDFFDQIRPMFKGPILAKGILTGEDAKLCVEHGLDGIYVSNHGSRTLDYDPSTLEVLAEVVDAVQGKVPVLFDSGIRRGTDALKALALGAKAVGVGRPGRWALGAFGAAGVQRVLEIIQAEFLLAMASCGVSNLADINRSLVKVDIP